MVLCGDTDAVAKLDINDPGNPQNKHRTRESQRQLRALLMEWDPIGVAGAPEAADEYDCMLSPLLRRLHDGVSDKEIQDWVAGEVEGHFGLHSTVIGKPSWSDRSSVGGGIARRNRLLDR